MASTDEIIRDLQIRVAALEELFARLGERVGSAQPPAGKLQAAAKGAAATPAGPEHDHELLELLAANKLIAAIKRYRELTGAGLRDAKLAVEAMHRGR